MIQILAMASVNSTGMYAIASGLGFLNTFQTNVISVISTIALCWSAWNIVQQLTRKKWAEMIGFIVIAACAFYLLDGITKLKTLGNFLMSTFFGL